MNARPTPAAAGTPWNADSVAAHRRAAGLAAIDPALCTDVAAILEDLRLGLGRVPACPWFAPQPCGSEPEHARG